MLPRESSFWRTAVDNHLMFGNEQTVFCLPTANNADSISCDIQRSPPLLRGICRVQADPFHFRDHQAALFLVYGRVLNELAADFAAGEGRQSGFGADQNGTDWTPTSRSFQAPGGRVTVPGPLNDRLIAEIGDESKVNEDQKRRRGKLGSAKQASFGPWGNNSAGTPKQAHPRLVGADVARAHDTAPEFCPR
jgi:hypothetical protein